MNLLNTISEAFFGNHVKDSRIALHKLGPYWVSTVRLVNLDSIRFETIVFGPGPMDEYDQYTVESESKGQAKRKHHQTIGRLMEEIDSAYPTNEGDEAGFLAHLCSR